MKMTFLLLLIFTSFLPTAHARPLSDIKASQELRICYVPWLGKPGDKKSLGPDHGLAGLFSEYLGVKPKYVTIQWEEQFRASDGNVYRDLPSTPRLFETGVCDLFASNLSVTEWRQNMMDFVVIFSGRMLVVVRSEELTGYASPASLAGKKTSVIRDTTYEAWLDEQNRSLFKNKPIKISRLSKGDTLEDVMLKKTDFAVVDTFIALLGVHKIHKGLSMAMPVGSPDEIGWGFRKGNISLQESFQEFLKQEAGKESSRVNKLFREHYGISLDELRELGFITMGQK